MALKRRISYQWQIFIPLVACLWIAVGIAWWQIKNEREFRMDQIHTQLDLINNRINTAYEDDTDVRPFMDFITRYYRALPQYDLIRVSVYHDGQLIKSIGEPIGLTPSEEEREQGLTIAPGLNETPETIDEARKKGYYYYKVLNSSDGRLKVMTVLPFDQDIMEAAMPKTSVFYVILAIAMACTVFAYLSSRYFGRNITILKTIADRAATDPNFMPAMDYPHDELGDISRQIVHMYNERSLAMQRLKREHKVALNAIEEKARAKRQLTNNINHELRTPIGVIKGYLDTIVQNPDMDEASRNHFLHKAQEHVDRLVNLIADVSAITRLEEGSGLVSTEELDFHDLVYTIASDIDESGILGKMEFNFNVPLNCKIQGNYNLLTGIIINLVKNSVAYSKGSWCTLDYEKEEEGFYHFIFYDNGTGVDEKHIPHLFDRFYRIDTGRSRKAGGTGLGLPIVQNTIIAHGGTIEVLNVPGAGLGFRFSLPKNRKKTGITS